MSNTVNFAIEKAHLSLTDLFLMGCIISVAAFFYKKHIEREHEQRVCRQLFMKTNAYPVSDVKKPLSPTQVLYRPVEAERMV